MFFVLYTCFLLVYVCVRVCVCMCVPFVGWVYEIMNGYCVVFGVFWGNAEHSSSLCCTTGIKYRGTYSRVCDMVHIKYPLFK